MTPQAPATGITGWILFPLYVLAVACLLTLCDYFFHVRTGVLYYTQPEHLSLFPGQPTGDVFAGFVPLGVACLATGWAFFRHLPTPGVPGALLSTFLFVATYGASGLFQDWPMSLYVAFMLLWLLQLSFLFRHDLRKLLALSVVLGLAGPVWEGYTSASGFFAYYDQDAYHVPLWLGGMYFNGALAVAATMAAVESWRRPRAYATAR